MKHYHQPKCNQPGHNFVDEDQEKKPLNIQQNSKYLDLEDFPFVLFAGGGVSLSLPEKVQEVWSVKR